MRRMTRLLSVFLALVTLLTALFALQPAALAASKTAKDVVKNCKFKASKNQDKTFQMKNTVLNKLWNGGKDGSLTVTLPNKQKAQGVMLAFSTYVPKLVIESMDSADHAQIAQFRDPYYNQYIPFSQPVHSFRIRAAEDNTEAIRISRMNVLTEGTLPSWVQRWEQMEDGDAEILLIVTHPDDDILWFGGLLPTYAGELGKKVLVAYAETGYRWDRRNELLDALWLCGVKYYPYMQKGATGAPDYTAYAVSCIRQYKPQVVVTQDVNGEYGHKAHLALVAAVIKAVVNYSGDAGAYPDSAALYGAYQPQKLYVHLWKENQSTFDWSVKLSAFGGKTGMALARAAFKKHASQQNGRHAVIDHGAYDCRKLGLYWTNVGPDNTKTPDLLQNVMDDKISVAVTIQN
ncbi:MAG: PIG-L family deacetylase [Clostridia bacterium]|nr:PIG-L family deacetylase [Clostridia bacterium]